ncbi:MAG TPA: DUF3054 domain-containing protein [Gaiellaceae bacterium]|jgi:hypothetical protein|nr:DUF3054 domain-containing protein [Gaiellaceae bacterium]
MRLVLSDVAAIVLFATVGQLSHDGTVSIAGYGRDALPIGAAWLAVAFAVRLYERGGTWRLLATWAAGVTLGVTLRGLALGRDLDGGQLAFLGTSLAFTIVFVLALRALTARAAPRAPASPDPVRRS